MNLRNLKDLAKKGLHRSFVIGQRLGFDLLPRHFYSEIPDIRALREDSSWKAPFSMMGVSGAALEPQLAFVGSCVTPEITAHLIATDVYAAACRDNGSAGYGRVEADILFAFVASHRPAEIFQIGCGVSTALCVAAARYSGYSPRITCIEPYPTPMLIRLADEGSIRLERTRAQTLDISSLEALGEDTLFFVDSSHTLGPAGEVSRIVLEMLPRLKKGAVIHFHDIYFPYDYEPNILKEAVFFHHESALLQGFLTYNSRFSILASCSMLHYGAQEALRRLLPRYSPAPHDFGLCVGEGHFPSSTFIRVSD
jgi:methyltransferase family protein